MNKKCLKCVSVKTKIDCYQCNLISEYNKKAKKEFSRYLDFLLFGFCVMAGFCIIDRILSISFPNVEFGLSFGLWGICLCFVIYCLPLKRKKGKIKGSIS